MRFSIVTITFNAEKYLRETLKSVAVQKFTDFEHLIWDGGSTDSTLEIAKDFPHVKIFQGKDEGISDAMNKGVSFAIGEYVLHLHADDLLAHENVLSFVDHAFKAHSDAQWLYGKADLINERGEKRGTIPFTDFSYKRLKKYNIIAHPSTFISRELFLKAGGFKKELKYCMDYDLWLRLGRDFPPFAFPTTLSCFRTHNGSTSTANPLKVALEAYHVRNCYAQSLWDRYRSYRTWKKREKKIAHSS